MRKELFPWHDASDDNSPPSFKAEAVRLAHIGDRSISLIATDLDLTESALREWIARAECEAAMALWGCGSRPSVGWSSCGTSRVGDNVERSG